MSGLVTRKGAEVKIHQPGAPGNPRSDAHMIECSACLGRHFLPLPMEMGAFVARLKSLDKEHAKCAAPSPPR